MVSILVSVVVFAVPTALIATLLYWNIRLGVKHGLRSYDADKLGAQD
jgi:hypothetical protein